MALSPMMQQYSQIKAQYGDAILMFRLGDFYEMFFDDAKTASRTLELTLTGRDCGDGERAPMCGVPYHAVDNYIGRLVKAGYKVVICEQMEDPATTKGIVKRDIVRIVTPGTVTDSRQLDETKNNYICAMYKCPSGIALCFADASTGEMRATEFSSSDMEKRAENELAVYSPREIITNADMKEQEKSELAIYIRERLHPAIYDKLEAIFDDNSSREAIARILGEDKIPTSSAIRSAAGALILYLENNIRSENFAIKALEIYEQNNFLGMDSSTRRNLEITETMRERDKKGSLLWVLDKTKSAAGARMLRRWLEQPLLSDRQINLRLDAVSELADSFIVREDISSLLRDVLDLERLLTKVEYGSAGGKDLRAMVQTLKIIPGVKAALEGMRSEGLASIRDNIDDLADIVALIDEAIAEDPPFSVREGGFIKAGFNEEVDRLQEIAGDARGFLSKIEAREKEKTGIKNLRVGYTRVFGYYIEVSKSNVADVPAEYIRKQTLVNGERFITDELKDLEATILGAAERDHALEYEIFCAVCGKVNGAAARIRESADMLARLDCFLSLADVAVRNRYVRPEITLDDTIELVNSRHPVVEQFTRDTLFVPNDVHLDTRDQRFILITGPNMAGKSTYMRQVALICVMAQIGSFVPADEARIGIVDKIFTRVGASDDLSSGQSTFMLEMNEVANILRNATKRSLLVYDEIGRGTSTYDGMSIARAVAEYTASKKLGARTLFATHYHELTTLEGEVEGIVNYNIAAKKKGDSVVFLRKIVRGAADDSYGIEVAKLAGIPNEIIKRAREVLAAIESDSEISLPQKEKNSQGDDNMSIDDYLSFEIAERIRSTDIDTLTPIEALNLIYELKKMQ